MGGAQGVAEAGEADLLLLTDADIVHDPAISPPWWRRPSGTTSTWSPRWWRWLRQLGGAGAGAGFCVLLPVALPIRLGERSASRQPRRRQAARSSSAGGPCRGSAESRRCEAN